MCYNLCVVDECHVYRVTDLNELATINDFIREVDGYWAAVETASNEESDARADLRAAVAACVSGVAGVGAAVAGGRGREPIAGIPPQILVWLGIVGAIAGGAACVFSVMSWIDDNNSSSDAAVEQIRHFNNALGYFNTLREVWDEAEVFP